MAVKEQQYEKTLRIYPISGQVSSVPPEHLDIHTSPDILNMVVYNGRLRKRPGYTQYKSGNAAFSKPVVGIASTQDEENATHLFAMTETELKKFNTGTKVWDTCTGPALTGASDRLFWWEVSQNSLVFSQGADQVQRIPFNSTTYAILNANCPPARYGTRGADRLILASTYESAANKPFRVRRSVAQDHTNWTGVGAGFVDLSEFPYHIKNIRKLGSRVIVYTEQAIWVGTRTTDALAPLSWEPVITESGLYAPFTLTGRRNGHFGLGNDDFFEFDGAAYNSIGEAIRDDVYTQLNSGRVQVMFGATLFDTQEACFFVCTGGSNWPNYVYVYNYGRRIWYKWSVSGPQCGCIHRADSGPTWGSAVGSWSDNTLEWDSTALQTSQRRLLTGHTDGKVYEWSLGSLSDAGVAIRAYWTSKDFTSRDIDPEYHDREITLKDVTLKLQDPGMTHVLKIYYSVNGGDTWSLADTLTIGSGTGGELEAVCTQQVSGFRIRVRIEQESADQSFILSAVHPHLELRDMPVH